MCVSYTAVNSAIICCAVEGPILKKKYFLAAALACSAANASAYDFSYSFADNQDPGKIVATITGTFDGTGSDQ